MAETGQMIGIKDIAREAGVSVGTVSNVLNRPEAVTPQTRDRVRAVIEDLGYVRSESARQLRMGHSRMLGLLVLDMTNPFFVDLAAGAEGAAREAGLGVMLCNSGQSPAEEAAYLSFFAEQRVQGVLVSTSDESGRTLADFHRHRIPHVSVDRIVPSVDSCSVTLDDVAGGQLAAAHLLEEGHDSLVYVSGPMRLPQCQDRRTGALRALREAGLDDGALRLVESDRLDIAAGRDAGSRLLGMSPRPTAVFCANDLLALGVLQTLYGAGLTVPEDMALVGYDDIEFAAAAVVPITSVRQPARSMGRRAAELLLAETRSGQAGHEHEHVVFAPELVVRKSSLSGGRNG